MTPVPTLKLNDGRALPQLGLGVWQMSGAEATSAVATAIAAGYRLIDTAAIYGNEAGVGAGIRKSGMAREELFVTTKLWNDHHGHEAARRALQQSLGKLRLDYVDLYLIHWPAPRTGKFADAWRALVDLKADGLARSIGVSNFNVDHLERIIDATGVPPAMNQIELHPHLQQHALRASHAKHSIATQAWSPLGQGRALKDPAIVALARHHARTPAQIILRWQVQLDVSTIPKSVTPARIRENLDVLGFELSAADMTTIASLDRGERIGPDPSVFG